MDLNSSVRGCTVVENPGGAGGGGGGGGHSGKKAKILCRHQKNIFFAILDNSKNILEKKFLWSDLILGYLVL